jgi:multiple sugar transport system permease protein
MTTGQKITVYGLLTAGGVLLLFPLYWMLVVSLAEPGQAAKAAVSAEGFSLVPRVAEGWQNYPDALRNVGTGAGRPAVSNDGSWWGRLRGAYNAAVGPYTGFLDAFANTVVITAFTVLGSVLSCSLVGYGFARLRFRGRGPLFVLMLATMMLPFQVIMIPLFILFRSLGCIDTFLPLVVPAFFGNAFYIFLFRQFFAQIPEALVEAARIDGCGHLRTWWTIMLPLCRPIIALTAVFTFMFAWNDFLGPLIYLQSEQQYTLAIALNSFRNQYGGVNQVHLLMAASLVTMLPCIVLFFVAQRQFVGGLSIGGVKG